MFKFLDSVFTRTRHINTILPRDIKYFISRVTTHLLKRCDKTFCSYPLHLLFVVYIHLIIKMSFYCVVSNGHRPVRKSL